MHSLFKNVGYGGLDQKMLISVSTKRDVGWWRAISSDCMRDLGRGYFKCSDGVGAHCIRGGRRLDEHCGWRMDGPLACGVGRGAEDFVRWSAEELVVSRSL